MVPNIIHIGMSHRIEIIAFHFQRIDCGTIFWYQAYMKFEEVAYHEGEHNQHKETIW